MIKSVTLENFQSHPKLTLEMGKLTMLTGTSNSGKSAVLRALAGLLRNDSVDQYVTHGKKSLKVMVETENGLVEWIKGGGENTYIITDNDFKTRAFHKVGSEVPEEVRDFLRMSPIALTDKIKLHANLHEQLESPFLVSKDYTAGDAAKIFGELTSASKLYAAVAEGNRRGKAAMGLRKTRRGDLEELGKQLKDYEDLDAQREAVESATEHWDGALSWDYAIGEAQKLLTTISEKTSELETLDSRLPSLQVAASIDLDAVTASVEQYRKLDAAMLNHKKAVETLEVLDKLEGPLTAAAQVDLSEIEALSVQIAALENALKTWEARNDLATSTARAFTYAESELEALEKELMEAYTSLDTCPSCGQELTADEAKAHLLGATHA